MEETYLIKKIRPYHTNKSKEIKKSPKIYFLDLGVRNYFINNFNRIDKRNDKGQIWENYILSELLKGGYHNIKYWRTRQGQEVDFVIDGESPIPLEMKYISRAKKDEYANLLGFAELYNIKKAYLISTNRNDRLESRERIVKFLPGINFLQGLREEE